MWLVLSFFVLYTVHAQAAFGRSYLGNSRLCHQWSCINEKLNLTDSLPPKDKYEATITSLLPSEWRDLGQNAVEACYGNKTKKYTNTCPGQALMHCIVNHLFENCPEDKRSRDDNCAPVSSLASNKYMFSQSRYSDFDKNLPTERRPSWFLRNIFQKKCCELPKLFSEEILAKCSFTKFMQYHIHNVETDQPFSYIFPRLIHKTLQAPTEKSNLQVVNLETMTDPGNAFEEEMDPLECCDLSGFIEDTWRNECHFEMSWNVTQRLGVIDVSSHEPPTTTTTEEPINLVQRIDVKMVPLPCEKETCVFKKLNVTSESGEFDTIAFTKLLDNMTATYPEWNKAKARVVTQCLSKLHRIYEAECGVNEILACVFDVLSENCPHANKEDPCRRKDIKDKDLICQISTAKYTPKLRRQFCGIPNLVSPEVLSECGMTSLSTLQYVPIYEKTVSHHWESKIRCQELTPPTSCLLEKMGVLNKYGFVDYFKMKHLLHKYSSPPLYNLYFAALLTTPMYQEYCNSPKQLLNIIDFMLMTCPETKRKEDAQCKKIFHELQTTIPPKMTQDQLERMFKTLQNTVNQTSHTVKQNSKNPVTSSPLKNKSYTNTNTIYDYGILGGDAPPVNIIDLKPKPKTLVILPVYQRMNKTYYPIQSLQNDGIFRS